MKALQVSLLTLALATAPAFAAVDVRIDAELINDNLGSAGKQAPAAAQPAAGKSTGPKAITQDKGIRFTLRSGSRAKGEATLRYWMFGADAKQPSKRSLIGGGESPIALKPNTVETISSDRVQSTFTLKPVFAAPPAAAAAKGAKPAAAAQKPAEASGTKFIGYGWQLIQDGKVALEFFSEPSMKTFVKADGDKPGEPFKAAAEAKTDGAAQ